MVEAPKFVEFIRARCPYCESSNIVGVWYKGNMRKYKCRERRCGKEFKARVR